MPKSIHALNRMNLDVLQAIKRAFLYHGVVVAPGDRAKKAQKDNSSAKEESKPASPPIDSGGSGEAQPIVSGADSSQEVHEKLIDITEKAQDVLFRADTVFPLTLFPDTITLDREKLTVATRSFFKTAKIVSVPVSSISSAEVDVGPFFGSLHMASKYFVQNTYSVNFLSRSDAMRLEHLLQGFIISQEKKIDLTDIDKEDLLVLLDDLGQGVPE